MYEQIEKHTQQKHWLLLDLLFHCMYHFPHLVLMIIQFAHYMFPLQNHIQWQYNWYCFFKIFSFELSEVFKNLPKTTGKNSL